MEQGYKPLQEKQVPRDHMEPGEHPGLTDERSVQGSLGHQAFHIPTDPAHPEGPHLICYLRT